MEGNCPRSDPIVDWQSPRSLRNCNGFFRQQWFASSDINDEEESQELGNFFLLVDAHDRSCCPCQPRPLVVGHDDGLLVFPIYLPSIIAGSIRCRRFLRRLEMATSG